MKEPIIILGPGRCGSTLLQRIINTSENITIWGEHEGFLSKLAESYYVLTESEGMQKNFYSQPIDPSIIIGPLIDYHACPNWINSFDKKIIKETYITTIANLLNNELDINKNYWGFKEIRYTKNDLALDMWLELFPNSYFIFSLRNPFDVIRSMIIDWNNPQTMQLLIDRNNFSQIEKLIVNYAIRWERVVSSFQYWIEEKKLRCYIEKYEDLLIDPETSIKQMFDFINLPMPETAIAPMSVRVGSRKLVYASKIREIIYDMRGEIWKIVGETAEYFDYDFNIVDSFKSKNKLELSNK